MEKSLNFAQYLCTVKCMRLLKEMTDQRIRLEKQFLRKTCIDVNQYRILQRLEAGNGLIIKEACHLLDDNRPALMKSLSSLLAHEFITIKNKPFDKRQKHIVITEKGQKLIQNIHTNLLRMLLEFDLDSDINKINEANAKLQDISRLLDNLSEYMSKIKYDPDDSFRRH